MSKEIKKILDAIDTTLPSLAAVTTYLEAFLENSELEDIKAFLGIYHGLLVENKIHEKVDATNVIDQVKAVTVVLGVETSLKAIKLRLESMESEQKQSVKN